jgi:hypothetical protein
MTNEQKEKNLLEAGLQKVINIRKLRVNVEKVNRWVSTILPLRERVEIFFKDVLKCRLPCSP